MRWRVRLYCGHIVKATRHIENAEPILHGSSSEQYSECGKNPARIVAFEPIGSLHELPSCEVGPSAAQPPNLAIR